jgi:hypothetical protein
VGKMRWRRIGLGTLLVTGLIDCLALGYAIDFFNYFTSLSNRDAQAPSVFLGLILPALAVILLTNAFLLGFACWAWQYQQSV